MFRTTSIKTRLVFSGVVSTLGIALIASIGVFGLYRSDVELRHQITSTASIRHLMMADMMHEGLLAVVTASVLVGEDGDAAERASMMARVADGVATFRDAVDSLARLDLPTEVDTQLQAVRPALEDYLVGAEETVSLALNNAVAGRAALEDFELRFDALETHLGNLGDLIETLAAETAEQGQSLDRMLMLAMIAASLVASAAIAFIGWHVARGVSKPIERLREALRQVAEGEMGLRIGDITRDDDIGAIARDIDRVSERVEIAMAEQKEMQGAAEKVIRELGNGLQHIAQGRFDVAIEKPFAEVYEPLRRNFNDTVATMGDLITQVVAASESIHTRSSEISTASEDLAARTETQAATLEETTAALEEMTENVKGAARNAKSVESAVVKARTDVEKSGEIAQQTIASMNEIAASSEGISTIIGLIDDITFQTNLLALNAGVEAARAGEAGRGFAVVASEVRGLAQRSAEAAQEIKDLIRRSAEQVEGGVRQVDSMGQSLASIVGQVSEISDLMSQIAAGAEEQAHGLGEINVGVAELDRVTQQNAAMVVQTGGASQTLNREAEGMRSLVSRFTVAKAEMSSPAASRAA